MLKNLCFIFFRRMYNIYTYILYMRCKDVTLISNNCIAGFIHHDVRQKFNSPTINLQIAPCDYVKFVNNMDLYMSYELVEVKKPNLEGFKKLGGTEINFPVGKLGDIIIYFQHYKTFIDAKEKWEKRKKRIINDRIILLLVDTFCDKDIIDAYSNAPYKKIFLSNDSDKTGWLKNGTFLKYDSKLCTEWHNVAHCFGKLPDLLGRRYFEKTNIFQCIFK